MADHEGLFTFEGLRSVSRGELIAEVNRQLARAEEAGGLDTAHHLLRVELLMQVWRRGRRAARISS
jgi:hypothetical protein